VWVPGCATGEEVYSIAIALVEYLGERLTAQGNQIFGTDVSETAIEKARAGVYLDTIVQDVSDERLARFFVKTDDHYRIAKSIRELCIFARQDVTRDPPFSRLDLVSCRNLLIYLDTTAQRRVMQIFHYALHPQGFLALGPSESVGQAANLFELIDKHHRIYTRKPMAPGAGVDLVQRHGAPYSRPRESAADEVPHILADLARHEAGRLLLARFAPASLLVEIAPAVAEARESGAQVRREGLCVDQLRDITLEVIPLKRPGAQHCYLILFEDGSRPAPRRSGPTVRWWISDCRA